MSAARTTAPIPHAYLSTTTYLTNLAILVVIGLLAYLALRWLRGKARASRLRAWEREGLLDEQELRERDPDLRRDEDDPRG